MTQNESTPIFRQNAATPFEELDFSTEGQTVVLRHSRENSVVPTVVLGFCAFLFMVFVVSVMPLMQLTKWGNALWILIGLAVLGAVAVGTQSVLKVTTLRLTREGVEIQHGTDLDRETFSIDWKQIAGVELEPVDAKDGKKGMRLRLLPREGEPIDTLPGVNVAELNAVRRMCLAQVMQQANAAVDEPRA